MTAFQFGPKKKKEKNSLKKRGTATPADKKKTRYKLGNEKKKIIKPLPGQPMNLPPPQGIS